jgi:hypothetical protein
VRIRIHPALLTKEPGGMVDGRRPGSVPPGPDRDELVPTAGAAAAAPTAAPAALHLDVGMKLGEASDLRHDALLMFVIKPAISR